MTSTFLGPMALLVFVVSMAFWGRAIRRVEIPKHRVGYVTAWGIAAGLALAALLDDPGWLGGLSAGLALLASAFLMFTVSISQQKVGDEAIRIGATIPHFRSTDEHGQPFDSASLEGHPVLIKFFRGHW